MEELNKHSGGANMPSEFKDPFTNDSVESVDYSFNKTKSFFREDKFHQAVIYLKNGNTSGEQRFYDDDPETLRRKVENFINNLE